ncbi:MAG: hypothetical protein JWM14_1965 [Chitinophagaceae bacterium]|nr:hypothetical protein [Chitinophagaceae bacterium]
MENQITISKRPEEINISNIEIVKNQCIRNAFLVARENSDVEIVEGLIISIDNNNGGNALAHIWNIKGNVHFDITKEKIWLNTSEFEETKEIQYFFTKIHSINDFKKGDEFKFSLETRENVDVVNEILERKSTSNT